MLKLVLSALQFGHDFWCLEPRSLASSFEVPLEKAIVQPDPRAMNVVDLCSGKGMGYCCPAFMPNLLLLQ